MVSSSILAPAGHVDALAGAETRPAVGDHHGVPAVGGDGHRGDIAHGHIPDVVDHQPPDKEPGLAPDHDGSAIGREGQVVDGPQADRRGGHAAVHAWRQTRKISSYVPK